MTGESVKPSDEIIKQILDGTIENQLIPRQWVNWAAEYIGEPERYEVKVYSLGEMIKAYWTLYEACKWYQEEKEDE